ncbi:hypothetical protein [Thiobacillus denitrificans]|uniref:t-SNARE coiled-coil homology domain-containing protein n=1 Tax=Thiobacillus denitrificans TaxID=36861 RepID=A0A106BVT6_THIDE|nr:hypothetical protein [Thiobacillus denitrificans]KVW99503.1 hypothetical protein ABW22_01405 [Thiobacillus denitrificans]
MDREKTTSPHSARRRHNDPDDSDAYVHRRKSDSDAVLHLHGRVADCEESIQKILESQQMMTENLMRLTDNTGRLADVLEAWGNLKGFWVTIRVMGTVAKVTLPVLALLGALWLFFKTGQFEIK